MKGNNIFKIATVLLSAALMLSLVGGSIASATSGPGDPEPAKISAYANYFYRTPAVITTTGTLYTASPLTRNGVDISRIIVWNSADVFVTAVVSGTAAVTVTPQFSADQLNWVNATYTYLANTTVNTTTTTSVAKATYQVVLNSSTSTYIKLPMTGAYLRFKIDSAGTITPSIAVVLKSN